MPHGGHGTPGVDKVVFDAVAFVRGLIGPFGIWGRLLFDRALEYRLVVSEPIVEEVLDVLARPEVARKFRGLAGRDIGEVRRLLASAESVEPAVIAPVCRDPDDDKYLATAVAAGATYLVSADRDLLDLGVHKSVRIIDAATFLEELERVGQRSPEASAPPDEPSEAEDETTVEGEFREVGSER